MTQKPVTPATPMAPQARKVPGITKTGDVSLKRPAAEAQEQTAPQQPTPEGKATVVKPVEPGPVAPAGPTTETQTGPQVAYPEKHPETSLWVNYSTGPVRIYEGKGTQDDPIIVIWDLNDVPAPTTGLYLLIEEGAPGGTCANPSPRPADTTTLDSPDEGYKTGSPHAYSYLAHTPLTAGKTYYLKGCAFDLNLPYPNQYAGYETNTVKIEVLPLLPDLVVSDLSLSPNYHYPDRLHVKLSNIGPTAMPRMNRYGPYMRYSLKVQTLSGPASNLETEGNADGIAKGESTEQLDHVVPAAGIHRFTVCINTNRLVEEARYDNNCRMETSHMLSVDDLEIVDGEFHLPKGEETSWHPFRGAVGISDPYAIVQVRNNGTRVARNFEVSLISPQFASLGTTPTSTNVKWLFPGEIQEIRVYFSRTNFRDMSGCCQVRAVVDPANAIVEFNENNNERQLPTVRE
jgi:hypothetical protein